jgi:hypothetical protein
VRHPDWVDRMHKTLEGMKDRPYAYGACVAIAAEVVDAISDSSWRADIDPLIADEASARALIAEPGSLEALVTKRLGEPVPMGLAMRGDPVLLELGSGPSLGICTGDRIACPAENKGIAALNRDRGIKAWRVS